MAINSKYARWFGAAAIAVAAFSATNVAAEDLTLWTLNFDNGAANGALKKVATDFEAANPGTHIEIVQRGVDEHKTALRVAAGSSKGPDIYFSWAGLGLGGEYVKAGLSLPLDKYYTQYKWNDELLPSAAAFADLYPGGKHGVPFTFKGEAIYYNKKLFQKAGITQEPKTYEELLADAEKLKTAGIPAFTFGGSVNWHVMRLMDVLLETKCGADKHDALMAMKTDWTKEPCATDAFTEFAKWTKDYTLKPFMGISNQQSYTLFVAGRAAMMLEGDWLVSQLSGSKVNLDDYGVVPFPTNTNRLYGFAEYNYISTKSKDPDLAAKFLDYFLSTKVQQDLVGQISSISVNKNVQYTDQKPLEAKWLDIFKTYSKVYMNGDQAFPLDVTTEYFRVINDVASGNIQPADAAKQLQTFIAGRT
ncbi:ABC transporter substrate-binding protein [Rhizobium leucaenae]|uniref:Raffinose/stachyose/melibiose transport system substrate-binding protein n=1 Tax=Rhizobium leucaenae TaxID=29450 RepID=A0A7W7EKW4_9HYPH|nr:extracellular solute-binding protein [Rhizobium leucaenae]MBB4568847.1 raffinose/stachyose/melibiose transport system substrate-binding protein [Rhizobium leucaenae]MBB6302076.1 raffinose/stachyose/melibiose transport system substrate-binding protein [Rhizobium leucaenae]